MGECEGISENLHRLINSEEYENKKLVRLIDYEKDKQTALQDQIEKMRQQIKETSLQSELMNREMVDLNRQFTANTSLVGTLKVANKMSQQHVIDTYKKLDRLVEEGDKRVSQYETALQKKSEIWTGYEKKYCAIPGVPQLMLLEEEVASLEKKAEDIAQSLNERQPHCDPQLIEIVVQIAEQAVQNNRKKEELREKEEGVKKMRDKKDKLVEEQNLMMDEKAAAREEQRLLEEQMRQQQIVDHDNQGMSDMLASLPPSDYNYSINQAEGEEMETEDTPADEDQVGQNIQADTRPEPEVPRVRCPAPPTPNTLPKMSTPKPHFSAHKPVKPSFTTPSLISPILKATPKLKAFASPKPPSFASPKPPSLKTPTQRPTPNFLPKPATQIKTPSQIKPPTRQSIPIPSSFRSPAPVIRKPIVPFSPKTPTLSKPPPKLTPKLTAPTVSKIPRVSTPKFSETTPKFSAPKPSKPSQSFNMANFKTPTSVAPKQVEQRQSTPQYKVPKPRREIEEPKPAQVEMEQDCYQEQSNDWESSSFNFNQQSPQISSSNTDSTAMFGSSQDQEQGFGNFGFMEQTDESSGGGFGMFSSEDAAPQQGEGGGFSFNFGAEEEGGESNCNSLFG